MSLTVHPARALLRYEGLAYWLLFVLAGGAVILGVTFLSLPDLYYAVRSFRVAFAVAPPWIWALAFIIPAVVVVTVIVNAAAGNMRIRAAALPCIALGVIWGGFGVAAIPAVATGGVPSAIIIYSVVGCVTVIAGLIARGWDHWRTAAV